MTLRTQAISCAVTLMTLVSVSGPGKATIWEPMEQLTWDPTPQAQIIQSSSNLEMEVEEISRFDFTEVLQYDGSLQSVTIWMTSLVAIMLILMLVMIIVIPDAGRNS